MEHHDGKEATCTKKGWKEYDTCKREGCDHTTYEEIPALGHKYGDIIPKTEPTCSENGVEAHYKCSVCNKVFKDDEHKTETTLDELTIAINPTAHNFGEWIKNEGADTHTRVCSFNSEHTETENCHGGKATCIEQATCSVCGEKYGKLAKHDYQDGVCIVCGKGLEYSLNSDGNGYTVTGIGTCTDTELIIPSEYNAKPVTSIGDNAFERCTGLTSVTIPYSVTSIGKSAFSGCNNLQDIYITNIAAWCNISGLDNLMKYRSNNKLHINNELATSITIPNEVTAIPSYAFYNCTELTRVTIGGRVTSVGSWSFRGCTGLTRVTIPDSVTSIGEGAFYNCSELTNVTIGGSVTSIGSNAFFGCIGLTNVTIPVSVTSVGSWAFCGCTGLTSVTIPDSVKSIGSNAFNNCTGLTSVTIGGGVKSIGSGTFSNCSGLTDVTIPESVTSIGENAFLGCTRLSSVTIPESVTSIGNRAFYNTAWYANQSDGLVYAGKVAYEYKGTMPSNTSIVLEKGTLGIADYAFWGFTKLTSITIPNSVKSIGESAFYGCTGLTDITFDGTIEQWNAISKGYDWNENVQTTQVRCTDGTVSI